MSHIITVVLTRHKLSVNRLMVLLRIKGHIMVYVHCPIRRLPEYQGVCAICMGTHSGRVELESSGLFRLLAQGNNPHAMKKKSIFIKAISSFSFYGFFLKVHVVESEKEHYDGYGKNRPHNLHRGHGYEGHMFTLRINYVHYMVLFVMSDI